MKSDLLRGYRILLVEDNAPLAVFLEEMLRDAGADVVGPAAALSDAERLATANDRLSGALLDIRLLGHEEVWPAARILARNNVPFVFYTAHFDPGSLPAEWSGRPIVTKPSKADRIIAALAAAVSAR